MFDTALKRKAFSSTLLTWYVGHKRDLPWRHTKDPYKIWTSEVMLQQTTVATVIGYYQRWLKRFPTMKSLAQADIRDVLKAWQGLGYYNRARNFHRAAQIVIDQFGGELPQEPDGLRALPGFGPYTVGAVLSIAFNKPVTIVDANVRRVFQRILAVQNPEASFDKDLYKLLESVISRRSPGDFNQGLMELGALICRSKEPSCNVCPVKEFCSAYKKGIQELIPVPKQLKTENIRAVVGIIKEKNKILIQKRPSEGLLADLWEFPGGKVESRDKDLKEALKREILEETGANCSIGRYLGKVNHAYTQFRVELNVFEANVLKDFTPGKNMRWVTGKDLKNKYPMPSGSAKIVKKILKSDH
ncbi:MAG: A/G-specific adenine glycosylase [Candidatus Omnitrophica bacterium]|nr:A/G-specific adenine glycosylase [Candidatus Omnitrophota bacterium]